MTVGTLYVVGTPIGNLEDLTFRAVLILQKVDLIACEDTRHTRLLLARHAIRTPTVSYHEHNERRRAPELITRLAAGQSVALVSDAGMPVLSDPGYTLVVEAIRAGISVVPIPGPSAVTAAVAISGLPPDRFLFLGFLPRKSAERRRLLAQIATLPWTLVTFEAPHRIQTMLVDLEQVLGNRQIALVRELTKRFEEVVRGTVADVREHVRAVSPRGELTIVVAGASAASPGTTLNVTDQLRQLLAQGSSPKDAVKAVAQTHRLPKRTVYKLALEVLGKR